MARILSPEVYKRLSYEGTEVAVPEVVEQEVLTCPDCAFTTPSAEKMEEHFKEHSSADEEVTEEEATEEPKEGIEL